MDGGWTFPSAFTPPLLESLSPWDVAPTLPVDLSRGDVAGSGCLADGGDRILGPSCSWEALGERTTPLSPRRTVEGFDVTATGRGCIPFFLGDDGGSSCSC